jgi:hypothetical protein
VSLVCLGRDKVKVLGQVSSDLCCTKKISSLELFWDSGKAVSVKFITELEIGEDLSPHCWLSSV